MGTLYMKIICNCCTRQIIQNSKESDEYVCPGPATSMGFGEYCCGECSKDLDEHGLFPEEYANCLYEDKGSF